MAKHEFGIMQTAPKKVCDMMNTNWKNIVVFLLMMFI